MNIEEIPSGYAHCYATDEQCSQAAHCLRAQAARLNETQPTPREHLHCVTPAYVARVAAGTACAYFRPDTPSRYARGMRHLFDAIPRSSYSKIRDQVIRVFSSERAGHEGRHARTARTHSRDLRQSQPADTSIRRLRDRPLLGAINGLAPRLLARQNRGFCRSRTAAIVAATLHLGRGLTAPQSRSHCTAAAVLLHNGRGSFND